jgi:tetratricopeptide (TPR) repeat protein
MTDSSANYSLNAALGQSISHNNHGAAMLQSGDNATALSSLRMALLHSKEAINFLREEEELMSDSSNGHSLNDLMTRDIPPPLSEHDDDDGKSFIYIHAMTIPTSTFEKTADDSSASLLSGTHLSICIVYNLALTHHRAALEECNKNDTLHSMTGETSAMATGGLLLRKAAKFYQSTFSLLQQGECQLGSEFFTLVVLNNLGHVYQALNEMENAGQCFRHLLSTLMYIVDSGEQCSQVIGTDYLQCFIHSTSHLIVSNCSASAA